MTKKKTTDDGDLQNTTKTELNTLQSIEKSFYKNNEDANRRNTEKSLKWFSQYVPRSFNRVRTDRMFRDRSLWRQKVIPGSMYFFEYDAIHKDTLPVWDRFPLIFPWDEFTAKNGQKYMLGINLHYLPPAARFTAMKALIKTRNRKRYDESTKLKISWKVLQGLSGSKYFEHSVKMYKLSEIKSSFIKIPPSSWELALFLPLARWQKGSKATAWKIK